MEKIWLFLREVDWPLHQSDEVDDPRGVGPKLQGYKAKLYGGGAQERQLSEKFSEKLGKNWLFRREADWPVHQSDGLDDSRGLGPKLQGYKAKLYGGGPQERQMSWEIFEKIDYFINYTMTKALILIFASA